MINDLFLNLKFLIYVFLLFVCPVAVINGCNVALRPTGRGVESGVLTSVAVRGALFRSCEIMLQKGENSSNLIELSSRDLSLCDSLTQDLGEQLSVKYNLEKYSITTDSLRIIESL